MVRVPGRVQSKRFLAVSLALSCGVMFYVSMIEIFVKSLAAFRCGCCAVLHAGCAAACALMILGAVSVRCGDCCVLCVCSDEFCPTREVGDVCARGYGATTGFFFLGLAITSVLNMITSRQSLEFLCSKCGFSCGALAAASREGAESVSKEVAHAGAVNTEGSAQEPEPQPLPPGWEVKVTRGSFRPYFFHTHSGEYSWSFPGLQGTGHCACEDVEMSVAPQQREEEGVQMNIGTDLERNHPAVEDQAKLNATGLITGLAIAIHNFPEGLATFVAAMAEPSLGAAIAVAIAIHNVPEGVCVAMPIYYSTGSRLRAFMWATLSGVSEPIGALFGYLVLGGDVSQVAYGSMFGVVAGMMVYISLAELLPAAYRFESNPAVVTSAMVSGMVIMALSLIAFQV